MNILNEITEHKREEVARKKRLIPVSALMTLPSFGRATFPFSRSLLSHSPVGVIAEIKRASPSAGMIRENTDPAEIARRYRDAGAAAISVLTDEKFFSGSLEDLDNVRRAVAIPVLRKEFIIDEYQVIEARAHGADAILLIAAILTKQQLGNLYRLATEIGLECLVELYDSSEIDILDLERMSLVGINNRDLRTFTINTGRALEISRLLPTSTVKVAESGITSPGLLKQYRAGGISAVLVGEHLMKAEDPGLALENLIRSANE
jgi:indole-3-glycerol phosphate synthase